jgi:single-strand DNA-binding protein
MSLNKVTLIGLVGKEPDIRKTQDGKLIASFSLATSESWKDKSSGERKQSTEWHKIVIFGQLAEIVERYVKKGSKLYLEGSLKTREWIDKKDGVKKYTTEIVLQGFGSKLEMLDSKKSDLDNSFDKVEKAFDNQDDGIDDEIPF